MTSPAEKFLSLVPHRFTGRDHGVFQVPTRKDRSWSGTFRIADDGRVLMHDHGGDSAVEILAAVGLELKDLFPEPLTNHARSDRRPFPAIDALRVIAEDAMVVAAAAAAVAAGEPVSPGDRERIIVAAARIRGAMNACGLGGGYVRR